MQTAEEGCHPERAAGEKALRQKHTWHFRGSSPPTTWLACALRKKQKQEGRPVMESQSGGTASQMDGFDVCLEEASKATKGFLGKGKRG